MKGPLSALRSDALVYLVRHGETTANRAGIRQGHTDYPLTDRGAADALAVGAALGHLRFDGVFSSDLGRALKTAELIVSRSTHGSAEDIRATPLLREINFGIREGLGVDVSFEEARRRLAQERGVSAADVPTLAETDEELASRHASFAAYLRDSVSGGRTTVLCVSHGGFIRTLLRSLVPGLPDQKIDNCSVSVLRASWGETGLFEATLEPTLYNVIEHLVAPDSFDARIAFPQL